ncbi:hypothetical protein L208DRAFT_1394157 [Tricholoma matsutake]|nr:hypothetical protein L208DRAFT_1394157 [Tricholoma matsutake 945]
MIELPQTTRSTCTKGVWQGFRLLHLKEEQNPRVYDQSLDVYGHLQLIVRLRTALAYRECSEKNADQTPQTNTRSSGCKPIDKIIGRDARRN